MIELKAHGYTAWILPERGGSCVRLSRWGAEILRTPDSMADYEINPYMLGTPLLFFPNRISGGCFVFEGREYSLPVNEPATGCFLHGTLHATPFEVVERGENHATLRYVATPEKPYLTFPHAFTLTLEWLLEADGLHQTVSFRNDSALNMPVALAFHTTFRLPFTEEGQPEAVRMALDTSLEYSRNMANYLPDGGCTADYPDKEALAKGEYAPSAHAISRFFRMGDIKCMCLTDAAAGIRATYQAFAPYDYWMVFNGGAKNLICVEPQSWLSNCPNAPFPREEQGFDFIRPGEIRTYRTRMSIQRAEG